MEDNPTYKIHWPCYEPHEGAIVLASKFRGFPCEFVSREGHIVTYRRKE